VEERKPRYDKASVLEMATYFSGTAIADEDKLERWRFRGAGCCGHLCNLDDDESDCVKFEMRVNKSRVGPYPSTVNSCTELDRCSKMTGMDCRSI